MIFRSPAIRASPKSREYVSMVIVKCLDPSKETGYGEIFLKRSSIEHWHTHELNHPGGLFVEINMSSRYACSTNTRTLRTPSIFIFCCPLRRYIEDHSYREVPVIENLSTVSQAGCSIVN